MKVDIITRDEAEEFGLTGYHISGDTCYAIDSSLIIFQSDGQWHANGEVGDTYVDTIWNDAGTDDLGEMLRLVNDLMDD